MSRFEGIDDRGAAAVRRPGAPVVELLRAHAPMIAGYGLPFLLIVYVALKGGGYDAVLRGEVGIALWWIVLIGAAVGALPNARISPAGWGLLALLGAFAAWTALGMGWSESSERSAAELGRVATYIGVLAIAITAQGRDGLRRAVYAVGAAIALVAALALLSRLRSDWFPANEAAQVLGEEGRRLNYPLNYWNGLAALIAIGAPLVLWIAANAAHLVTRALAAAALPAMSMAAYFTLSRGGALELAAALVALIALYPNRLRLVPTLAIAGVGSALGVAAAAQRDALADGLDNSTAVSQSSEMLATAIILCAGVALLQVAIGLAERHQLLRLRAVDRRRAAIATAVAGAVCVVVALAAGAPGKLADSWEEFKNPAGLTDTAERLESASGNGRYQYWSSMVDAAEAEPLTGIGPGTFEFWWAREGTRTGFAQDAHSLYFESLGELGIPGLLLIAALMLFVLGYGAARALRAADERTRALSAAAVAGCVAFAVAAALDWVWELSVIPIAFLLLAAGLAASRDAGDPERTNPRPAPVRIGLVVLSLAAMVAVAIPLAVTASVRESQSLVNSARLGPALDEARSAGNVQPSAASPSIQEALVLELAGDLDAAAGAARAATEEEPTNFRNWLVLSRIEARRGAVDQSIDAYRQARELNPRSPIFQR